MNALPFDRFLVESALPPEELARRLRIRIERPKAFRWPWDPSDKPFEGEMDGNRFTFMTLLKFQRDSFRPVVVGTVEPRDGGSVIRGILRLHWAVATFMSAWVSVPVVVGVLAAARLPRPGPGDSSFASALFAALAPLPIALLGYLTCMVFFRLGVRRVKRVLADVAGSVTPRSRRRDRSSRHSGPGQAG